MEHAAQLDDRLCYARPRLGDGNAAGTVSAKAAACYQRLADEGYRQHIKYFTADRFWALQWREFGLFLLAAFALIGFSFWRIRRDLS